MKTKTITQFAFSVMMFFFLHISNKCFSQIEKQMFYKQNLLVYKTGNWYLKNSLSDTSLFLIDTTSIVLKFKAEVLVDSIPSILKNLKITKKRESMGFHNCRLSLDENYTSSLSEIEESGFFDEILISDLGRLNSNDTYFNNQAYLSDYLGIQSVWNNGIYGSPHVTVAVLDGFPDWSHPDTGKGTDSYENIWLNSREDAWSDPNDPNSGNGIDDDNNGYVDDWKGYDFYDDDNDSRPDPLYYSSNFHGTAMAGIIGGKINNNKGIAGIAGGNNNPGVKIMCLNVAMTNQSVGNNTVAIVEKYALAEAIEYACKNGAKIICIASTFAPNTNSPVIDAAIDLAVNKFNCIIVCASGNGQGSLNDVFYPANNPNVIAVGAFSRSSGGEFNSYTRGPEMDFTAFGMNDANNPYQAFPPNNYNLTGGGTSVAAAQIAGMFALLQSKYQCLPPDVALDLLKLNGSHYATCYPAPGVDNHCNNHGYGMPSISDAISELNNLLINYGSSHSISTNTTYNSLKIAQDDIYVRDGFTLTINAKLIMPEDRKIYVEKRGKLIVQGGGIITSNCTWGGIEVLGDYNEETPQSEFFDGLVMIKNGGTIENAMTGVRTRNSGIVKLDNGRMINNYTSIYFDDFEYNKIYAIARRNVVSSYFKVDKPIASPKYYKPGMNDMAEFIKVIGYNGLTIDSTQFISTPNQGIGLNAWNASVLIYHSTFQNLYEGVRLNSYGKDGIQHSQIQHNNFINVNRGYSFIACHDIRLSLNSFSLSDSYFTRGKKQTSWGVYSYNSSLRVDDISVSSSDNKAYGMIVKNNLLFNDFSGSYLSIKYPVRLNLNTFHNLLVGVQLEEDNSFTEIRCNDFLNNDVHNLSVMPFVKEYINYTPKFRDQGSPGAPAGNLFDVGKGRARNIRSGTAFIYHDGKGNERATPEDRTRNVTLGISHVDNDAHCAQNIISNPCGEIPCNSYQLRSQIETAENPEQKADAIHVLTEYYYSEKFSDSVISLLTEYNGEGEYDKVLISIYMSNKDWESADDLINQLEVFTEQDEDYIDMVSLLNSKIANGSAMDTLTPTQITLLENIINHQNDVSDWAGSYLYFATGIPYDQNPQQWPGDESGIGSRLNQNKAGKDQSKQIAEVIIYPNPSNNYLKFKWTDEILKETNLKISVYDPLGMKLHDYELNPKLVNEISTNDLPTGIYYVHFNSETVSVKSRPFSIIR